MKPMRRAGRALLATGAVAGVATVARRRGSVSWWTSEGQLALPALHPADRCLVGLAQALIRCA